MRKKHYRKIKETVKRIRVSDTKLPKVDYVISSTKLDMNLDKFFGPPAKRIKG